MKKKGKTQKKKKSKIKSKKRAAPIKSVAIYKKLLEDLQTKLSHTVQKKREEILPENDVGDEADVAVQSVTRDLVFEQSGNERHMLEEVEAALRRIEKRTYGQCESCSETIGAQRLKVVPHARYCVQCQVRFDSF